ncbi:Fatty acid hydroxylase superfamily protein [Enhygromyxa salina]|uniref:Fatty acid hydroxylase superfamily protein n=1 Tax=Enhygromyxa salina TaxID=215803 RepID=A0A2S9XKC8_9BACT|nr:sterol desaturase family protein [Enhygromyxa salina]PRP93315.1 Fatty acid hydroxylase superfamily protein [Enhygromyxa salina]
MLDHEMDWLMWASIVGASMLVGVAVLWIVAGYYHVRYYVRRGHEPETWKCQPKRFLRPDQQRQAAILSTINLSIGGFVSGNLVYAYLQGWELPKLYTEVADYGWLYTLGSTALLFVLMDGLAYYTHRAMHLKPLFKRIHRYHHRYIATSPFVVVAMHPLELLSLQAATFLPLFVMPFHVASVIVVLGYVLVFNIIDHSGVRLVSRIPWQGPSMYHDDHHVYFHVNFGQHLMFWDRIHGTLRREGRRYGVDNFGGKGKPGAGGSEDFVKYP